MGTEFLRPALMLTNSPLPYLRWSAAALKLKAIDPGLWRSAGFVEQQLGGEDLPLIKF